MVDKGEGYIINITDVEAYHTGEEAQIATTMHSDAAMTLSYLVMHPNRQSRCRSEWQHVVHGTPSFSWWP